MNWSLIWGFWQVAKHLPLTASSSPLTKQIWISISSCFTSFSHLMKWKLCTCGFPIFLPYSPHLSWKCQSARLKEKLLGFSCHHSLGLTFSITATSPSLDTTTCNFFITALEWTHRWTRHLVLPTEILIDNEPTEADYQLWNCEHQLSKLTEITVLINSHVYQCVHAVCRSAISNTQATCTALQQLLNLEGKRTYTGCSCWPDMHLHPMHSTHKKNIHWISCIVSILSYLPSSAGWMTFSWQYSLAWVTMAVLHSDGIISTPHSEKHVPLTKSTTCAAAILLKYSAQTLYCWSQSLVDGGSQVFGIWWSDNTKLYKSYLLFLFVVLYGSLCLEK